MWEAWETPDLAAQFAAGLLTCERAAPKQLLLPSCWRSTRPRSATVIGRRVPDVAVVGGSTVDLSPSAGEVVVDLC